MAHVRHEWLERGRAAVGVTGAALLLFGAGWANIARFAGHNALYFAIASLAINSL